MVFTVLQTDDHHHIAHPFPSSKHQSVARVRARTFDNKTDSKNR